MNGNLLIFLGTVLIAIGGVTATYGWNKNSSSETRKIIASNQMEEMESRKSSMLKAFHAELLNNFHIITSKRINPDNDEELSKFAFYGRLESSVLSSLISSGLFVEKSDRLLLTYLVDLNNRINDLNNRFGYIESTILNRPKSALEYRKAMKESEAIKVTSIRMTNIAKLLEQKYEVDLDASYFYNLDQIESSSKK